MKISVLMENTASRECFFRKHGLSFFIESDKNILFDMGPDDKFIENAALMGIDLNKTDFGVLSHGHYDHGGGFPEFIRRFPEKKVYISKFALGDFYVRKLCGAERQFIGSRVQSNHIVYIGLQIFDKGVESEQTARSIGLNVDFCTRLFFLLLHKGGYAITHQFVHRCLE